MTLKNNVPSAFGNTVPSAFTRKSDVEGTSSGNIPARTVVSGFGGLIPKSTQPMNGLTSYIAEDNQFSWLQPPAVDIPTTSPVALDATGEDELDSAKKEMPKQPKSEVAKQRLLKSHGVDPDDRWV